MKPRGAGEDEEYALLDITLPRLSRRVYIIGNDTELDTAILHRPRLSTSRTQCLSQNGK